MLPADHAAFALRAVRDRFDRLGRAATQRMHAHDVAAAHVREQRADRDLLRRQRDVDRAALHQLRVRRPVDQRHDLVTAEPLGEHRGQDVRLFGVGHGDEDVRAVDVLLEQQLLVGGVAVQHDGVAELLGDAPRAALDRARSA